MTKAAKKELDLLLAVQAIDAEILGLEREKARIPDSVAAREGELARFEAMVAGERKTLEEMILARKNTELEIDSSLEAIQKFKAQQFQVKKNEEYNALGKEIADQQHKKDQLEETVLGQIEEIEAREAKIARLADEEKAKGAELARFREKAAEELKALERRLGDVGRRREELVSNAPRSLLSVYDRIRQGKGDGVAVTRVERDACSSCQFKLPPQRVNELLRSEQVVLCEACGRILVLDQNATDGPDRP